MVELGRNNRKTEGHPKGKYTYIFVYSKLHVKYIHMCVYMCGIFMCMFTYGNLENNSDSQNSNNVTLLKEYLKVQYKYRSMQALYQL